jgi:hypothetical protein
MTGLEDLAHCAGNHATDTIFSEVYASTDVLGGRFVEPEQGEKQA